MIDCTYKASIALFVLSLLEDTLWFPVAYDWYMLLLGIPRGESCVR